MYADLIHCAKIHSFADLQSIASVALGHAHKYAPSRDLGLAALWLSRAGIWRRNGDLHTARVCMRHARRALERVEVGSCER